MSWSVTLDSWLIDKNTHLMKSGIWWTIIQEVRTRGDEALLDYAEKFDGVRPDAVRLDEQERDAAYEKVSPELEEALTEAYTRISKFHELQRREDLWITETEPGISLGVKTTPLTRIGIYVPGGRQVTRQLPHVCYSGQSRRGKEVICCTPRFILLHW